MDTSKISLIFCQSAVKVSATLVCYEKELSEGNEVLIIVRNVKSVYDFLCSLNLKAKVFWFDNHIKTKYWFLQIAAINQFVKEDISSLKVSPSLIDKVYFTSLCNDLLMGCYLKQFRKESIIKLQGLPDVENDLDAYELPSIDYSFKLKALQYIYSFFTNCKYRIQTVGAPVFAIDIGYYKYPLYDGSDMTVCEHYQYHIKKDGRCAIVYASDYTSDLGSREDYVSAFTKCMEVLKERGYEVYVKGHPRLGTLKEAALIADHVIPAYVPAEFLDNNCFILAFGLITAALCTISDKVKSYSLIHITNLTNDERFEGWCDYLRKTSKGKVLFLKSLDEIE